MSEKAAGIAAFLRDLDEREAKLAPRPHVSDEMMRRAFHEAGHAVGSRQLGLRVTTLSLCAAVSMVPLLEDSETMIDSGRKRFATVAYCGPAAEQRHAKLTGDECRTLWQDGGPWCGDRANIERCQLNDVDRAKARARAAWLVQTHWRKIDALAAALIERQTMTGDEMREVLRNVFFF
jgi:hypothetical protein